jgi:hypothetical protein
MNDEALGIYFINGDEIDAVCAGANAGDEVARDLYAAILNYIHCTTQDCPLCDQALSGDDLIFVVLILNDSITLTSCVCERCGHKENFHERVKQAVTELAARRGIKPLKPTLH